MTQKRKMWLTVCGVFTVMWGVLGLLIWPLLFFAFCSAVMGLIPIGVPEAEAHKVSHNPEAWRNHSQ